MAFAIDLFICIFIRNRSVHFSLYHFPSNASSYQIIYIILYQMEILLLYILYYVLYFIYYIYIFYF